MSESDRVLIEVVVAHPLKPVWKALRDPAEFAGGSAWDYAGLDEEIALMFGSGVTASKPSVSSASEPLEGMSDRFELAPHGERTVVRVIGGPC